MVQHKSVRFHCPENKKATSSFQEPEGMTNIDLKTLVEEKSEEEKDPKEVSRKSVRKYITKSLVICGFIIFGLLTLLLIIPEKDVYRTIKSAWTSVLHPVHNNSSLSEQNLPKLISGYVDKLATCQKTSNFEDCCAVLAEIHEDFVIEACTIDAIKDLIEKYGSIDKNTTKDGENHIKKLENHTSEEGNHIKDEESDFLGQPIYKFDYEDSEEENDGLFRSKVQISKVLQPLIDENGLRLQSDDVAILVTNDRVGNKPKLPLRLWKRQAYQYPYQGSYNQDVQQNFYGGKEMPHQQFQEINDKQYREDNQYYQTPQVQNLAYTSQFQPITPSNLQSYEESHILPQHEPLAEPQDDRQDVYSNHPMVQQNPITTEDSKRRFKYIKASEVKKKKKSNDDNDKEDKNPGILKPNECIPYNPDVRSPYQFLQQPTQFSYEKFAELLPVRSPGNPFGMNPQFGYTNPNYLPMIMPPSMTPQYAFNPIYMPQPMPSSVQASNPSGQYFICNPVPAPTQPNHLTSMAGVEIRESTSLQDMVDDLYENDTQSNKTRTSDTCPSNQVSCGDESKCIKEHQICDNEVNCKDASDELDCSCTDRIGRSRICDGFFDCPNGEDEIGCFGCDIDSFNCDDWTNDRDPTCIPLEQRCDGTVQCPTGKDEDDCAALSQSFGKSLPLYKISNSAGFLYKNHKGKWYPACSNGEIWAASACEKESGINILAPITRLIPVQAKYSGSFISALPENDVNIVKSCVPGFAVHVECPLPTCGKKIIPTNIYRSEEIEDRSFEDTNSRFERSNSRYERSNETEIDLLGDSRVVGGRPCQPASWPWVVSIYRNGIFHCGGTIITDEWIVSAAHCVDRYSKYYFEVEAGILRRFSYSPMQQSRYVYRVISHNAYDRANLKNDLALLKVSSPFKFNRYVRPICLPSEKTAGRGFMTGPRAGTLCTAVGWGATVEHGPDPDHLREVEVPVLSHCKHPEDEDGQEICAGLMEGGKDACQGDSGGPFMCRNPNSPNQWYLAGVVSHGEGCARPNEPGVYTRVSLYLGWIYDTIRSNMVPVRTPLHKCPGFQCKGTGKCLPKKRRCDRVVDCLLGDDEQHCEAGRMASLFDQAMRHVMVGSVLNASEVNKLGGEDTTSETPIDQTTLITIGEGRDQDSISTTTFTMENSGITDDMNRNEVTEGIGTTISDSGAPITKRYEDATTETTAITIQTNSSKEFFKCNVMLEIIDSSKRCDGVVDCQDATDEVNCSCVDYLKHRHPKSICDGINDCHDMSDEQNCDPCGPDKFHCRLSNMCIAEHKKCDRTKDCPNNEDEWDCFTLTDGSTVRLDDDLRPHLNTNGVVTFYYDGSWSPVCANWTDLEATAAAEICVSLGLADYSVFRQVKIDDGPLEVATKPQDGGATRDRIGKACDALYVKCTNVTILGEVAVEDSASVANEPLLSTPWIVAIYADGEFKCTGTLLSLEWVLTSTNCFQGISKIEDKHLAILSGADKGHLGVQGPHEQTRLVIQSTPVLFSDAILLKLEKSLNFNRYTRPVSLNFKGPAFNRKEVCIAVGRNTEDRLEAVVLRSIKNCTSGSRCFKRVQPPQKDCNYKAKPWSGTIVCETGSGLYPSAVYHEPHGSCGFILTSSFSNLALFKRSIKDIMGKEELPIYPKPCEGLRCPLGKCISSERICDGIQDCRNGYDEDESLCSKRQAACNLTNNCACAKSEMRCDNGKCVPKNAFCNQIDDCGDLSDEPTICSCYTYMNLTQPEKICDGVVNCEDKSDESPEACKCTSRTFKCGNSDYCVPIELVCDGENDCLSGEDEEQCIKLRPITQNKNEGEVVTRTAGEWHSGCFQENLSTSELSEICEKLGFANAQGSYMHNQFTRNKLADYPILNPYSVVWIHRNLKNKLRLAIRTGNDPIMSYKQSTDCYRLYIKCN